MKSRARVYVWIAVLVGATAIAACGKGAEVQEVGTAGAPPAGAITAPEAPKAGAFTFSSHGDGLAIAAPVVWESGKYTESWVGLFRAGEAQITVLPPLPLSSPFANPAVQLTDDAVLLVGQECPQPKGPDSSCNGGKPFALSYDLGSKVWKPFKAPPLPEGRNVALGLVDGAPTFGAFASGGPGGTDLLSIYAQTSGGGWDTLPSPPLLDATSACVTKRGLIAVESSSTTLSVQAGDKSFEQIEAEKKQLKELDDGSIDAARYDAKARSWTKWRLAKSGPVSTVTCQEPGILYVNGNTELVLDAGPDATTSFNTQHDVNPGSSILQIGDTLTATYATTEFHENSPDNPTIRLEQVTATEGKAAAPTRIEGEADPIGSWALGDTGYWAGRRGGVLNLFEIGAN